MTVGAGPDLSLLDNAVWHALQGPHARFAQVCGRAGRYRPEFARYSALSDARDDGAWQDLLRLAGPGAEVVLTGAPVDAPPGWTVSRVGRAVQLVAEDVRAGPEPEAVRLTTADVPEIFGLIRRTEPGPWLPRTVELGSYLGIRREGRIVAMAGERVHPTGWTEVSAVCTEAEFRNQGLASRLVRAVVHTIHSRGEEALLHAAVTNVEAIRLYQHLGFRIRRETRLTALVTPDD